MRNFNNTFTKFKNEFAREVNGKKSIESLVPVHKSNSIRCDILNSNNEITEQYYKWELVYCLINTGLISPDYIGTEIHFPKGNKNSADIILDGAVFDVKNWHEKYLDYHQNNNTDSLDYLHEHLICAIEIKKEDGKNVQEVWDKQLKAYLKESNRNYCLGILYDTGRLYLFKKKFGKYVRYNDDLNMKGDDSLSKDMKLNIPDSYLIIPDFEMMKKGVYVDSTDRNNRSIKDLDIISGIQSLQIKYAMSSILKVMDTTGLVDPTGFEILIQVFALKIYDEKQNEKGHCDKLNFYIDSDEYNQQSISSKTCQKFIERMQQLLNKTSNDYYKIFKNHVINFKDENHVKIIKEIVNQFQDYSFVRSQKTDLYQLVFYKFAGKFTEGEQAQFLTPLPLIDFLVKIVNPRKDESIIDPTVGIADFLSVSYVNSCSSLDDNNIFGVDITDKMVMLATLNMLLNGDGNAKIEAKIDGYGSIFSKFDKKGNLVELLPEFNKNGNWDNRPDSNELKKFDVVLTNPPFGDDRAYEINTNKDKLVIECYELWHLYKQKKLDKGVIFLENAYRILKENGRLGIVLSNSIASIDSHKIARKWLMENMRIVAMFDLPANVFAETGVNTSIIVAYKPKKDELENLKLKNYEIFSRNIEKVGYEVKTEKRVKYFDQKYKINSSTFEVCIDENGQPLLDEEFSKCVLDFRQWCLRQEETLKQLFVGN